MGTKRILLLDGLHCGSGWSISPNRFEWRDGKQKHIHIANEVQKILYKKWVEMTKTITNVHAVIYLGEVADGVDRKAWGKHQWTTSLDVQLACGAQLLDMIDFNDKKRFYIVQGSQYHSEYNLSADQQLSNVLNAEFGTDLLLDVNGVGIHATHFMGSAKSALDSEIDNYLARKKENGKVDIIIRGHKHNFKYAGKRGVLCIQLPSWKAKEDFSRRFGFKYVPEMGYVWIDIDDDGTFEWDYHTFTIEHGKMDRIVV